MDTRGEYSDTAGTLTQPQTRQTRIHRHTSTQTQRHADTYNLLYICIHVCILTHKHTHTHTHTHTHVGCAGKTDRQTQTNIGTQAHRH
jgi:hypothetical protein